MEKIVPGHTRITSILIITRYKVNPCTAYQKQVDKILKEINFNSRLIVP